MDSTSIKSPSNLNKEKLIKSNKIVISQEENKKLIEITDISFLTGFIFLYIINNN